MCVKIAAGVKQRAARCRDCLGEGAEPVHVEQERKDALGIVAVQTGRESRQRFAFVARIDEPLTGIDNETPVVRAIFVEKRLLPLQAIAQSAYELRVRNTWQSGWASRNSLDPSVEPLSTTRNRLTPMLR